MESNLRFTAFALALTLGFSICTGHCLAATAASAPGPSSNSDRIVVMISIDGLANFYFDDPKAEMPTIHRLAAEGAHANDGMKASTPTVTWTNHATLVTGVEPARHGVIGNNYFDRAERKRVTLIWDPLLDKDQLVKVPTLCDVAKAKGMKTAAIRWPVTRNDRSIDWNSPDVGSNDLVRRFTTPALMEECKAVGFVIDDNGGTDDPKGRKFEPQDEMWTHILVNVLRDHRPNFALLHVVNVDHTEHVSGPRSREAYAAIKAADEQVREVWEELQKDFPGKATLFVVSDHGFSPIDNAILPNVVLRKAGLVEADGKKVTGGSVGFVSQGGAGLIYVLDDANRTAIIEQIKQAFTGVEGVEKIIGAEDFQDYGVADPQVDPRAPDLILFAGMGYNFGDTAAGDLPIEVKAERKGSHGHDPNLPDLHATFVACGAGIRPGAQLGEIKNIDVAPTIAKLLNIDLTGVDGHPIAAALAE